MKRTLNTTVVLELSTFLSLPFSMQSRLKKIFTCTKSCRPWIVTYQYVRASFFKWSRYNLGDSIKQSGIRRSKFLLWQSTDTVKGIVIKLQTLRRWSAAKHPVGATLRIRFRGEERRGGGHASRPINRSIDLPCMSWSRRKTNKLLWQIQTL